MPDPPQLMVKTKATKTPLAPSCCSRLYVHFHFAPSWTYGGFTYTP